MARKKHNCTLCPKRFHTKEALDEHTALRHRDKLQRPSESEKFQYQKHKIGDRNA